MDFLYSISGLVVGFIVGLTGVGGGSLMTPLLVLVFGVAPVAAVGTDLLYAALTKTVGVFAHTRLGNVDWSIVKRLMLGSVPTSLLMTFILHTFGVESATTAMLIKVVLGVALLLTALALVFRAKIAAWSCAHLRLTARQTAVITVIVGAVLGMLVTFSSVGAGAIGVAALFFLYPQLTVQRIVGADIAHAVPLTLVAGLGHATLGTVDYHLLGLLLIGSIPGIWMGSHLSAHIPERWTRGALVTMLFIVGGRLVF